MPRNDTDIVKSIRTELAELIGRDRYELWFGEAVSLHFADGTLRVSSAQEFLLDRIRRGHASDLQRACQAVLGTSGQLVFDAQAPVPVDCTAGESRGEAEDAAEHDRPALQMAPVTRPPKTGHGRRFARLETLVVGDCNRLAVTAAKMLLDQSQKLSPMFVHGDHGTGKTHLLEGIYAAARRSNRVRRTVFLSAEQFTNFFLEALRGSGLPSFRRRYRDVDLLLIDDVQFFAGKRSTITEFQYTLDTLLRDGKQIVLSADRPPRDLTPLGSELVHRMSGGIVCPLDTIDYATRVGILQTMAKERGFDVPQSVVEQIGRELTGDARLLSGALNRLHATSVAAGKPITEELAQQALEDLFRTSKPLLRLSDIDQAVCDVFHLEPSTLQSNSRSKWISQPRMLAMWLARRYTRAAFVEIGEYFGRRSHSTVVSAQQKVDRWLADGTPIRGAQRDWRIDEAVRRVESKLGTA